jgi:hypothetical protein
MQHAGKDITSVADTLLLCFNERPRHVLQVPLSTSRACCT